MQSIFPHDRPVDKWPTSPASSKTGKVIDRNIPGRVQVGVDCKTTTGAAKFALALAAAAVAFTATAALLASIARIYRDNINPGQLSLVTDESLESREAPGVQSAALLPARLYTSSDVRQVFHCYGRSLRNRRDDLLRQHMVTVVAKTVDPTGQLLEMPLGRLGAFRLKGSFEPEVPFLDFAPTPLSKKLILTGNCGTTNPEINAHYISGWLWFRHVLLNRNMNPESPFPVHAKICGTDFPVYSAGVVQWNGKRNVLTTTDRGQRRSPLGKFYRSRPGIIANRTPCRLRKRYFPALLFQGTNRFQCFGGFHSCRTDKLRRKVCAPSLLFIGSMVQLNSVDTPFLVANSTDPVERTSEGLYGFVEDPYLFSTSLNPELHGKVHTHILTWLETKVNT